MHASLVIWRGLLRGLVEWWSLRRTAGYAGIVSPVLLPALAFTLTEQIYGKETWRLTAGRQFAEAGLGNTHHSHLHYLKFKEFDRFEKYLASFSTPMSLCLRDFLFYLYLLIPWLEPSLRVVPSTPRKFSVSPGQSLVETCTARV